MARQHLQSNSGLLEGRGSPMLTHPQHPYDMQLMKYDMQVHWRDDPAPWCRRDGPTHQLSGHKCFGTC
jgi:hypothetical protein